MGEKKFGIVIPEGVLFIGSNENAREVLKEHQLFIQKYCQDNGWDIEKLSDKQLRLLRARLRWENLD